MAIDAAPPTNRKPDRRTEAQELRLELWTKTHEERVYVQRSREGFVRIIRCLEGGLLPEAHQLAAAGKALADRRARQLGGTPDGSAA